MKQRGKKIKMEAVTSSNIAKVGYDSEKRILAIEFHSGQLYHYHPVTEDFFKQLKKAESIGEFFSKNIRNATGITYTKIT